jgi:hypothetical protein
MRVMDGQNDDFYYLLTNHLGSVTDVVAPSEEDTPTVVAKVPDLPWGETWEALTDATPAPTHNIPHTAPWRPSARGRWPAGCRAAARG